MTLDLSALDVVLAVDRLDVLNGVAARAPLDAFEEDPDNPRFERDLAAFDDLVADIRERGILQPIIVRRQGDGKLRIRFGSRRYRAAIHLALPDVPYVVTEDERQFDDYAQVAENERRSRLQPLELATFIAKKLAQGEKKKGVAARLRLDPSAVTHLLALVGDVPAFVLELYHLRKCRTPVYLYDLRRLSEANSLLVQQRCAEAVEIDRRMLNALMQEVVAGSKSAESTSNPDLPVAPAERAAHEPGLPVEKAVTGLAVRALLSEGPHLRPDWPKLLHPKLMGNFEGESVQVDFTLRPSSSSTVVVRDSAGIAREVPIGDVRLTRLGDDDG